MSVCLNETNVSVDLSIIVPFYNEADSLQRFFDVIIPILRDMNITYELKRCCTNSWIGLRSMKMCYPNR